ncbi:MAG: ACP S-malonyltransferase [Desulfovibrio sp.]|jgi:[acyl-carrier-protein] S-malonyltransferase|nr:ACP S-malonyltransferase [Desulfovibrio sp.]
MRIALLFPGQGSQEQGMGRDLAEARPEAMALWKKAEAASSLPLREIYWHGDEQDMALTRSLQPAITVVNLSLWMCLAASCAPSAAAGHSLGEYSALAAAGVLSLETTLNLVALRGRLMAECDPDGQGAMTALIRLDRSRAESCVAEARARCGRDLVLANYNTPSQFVASGHKEALGLLPSLVREAGGRVLPLAVSGAFHSPLMQEASRELNQALGKIGKGEWRTARFPVYSNVSARPETDAAALKAALERQMTSPVYWLDTIRAQWDQGMRAFVECGPKQVLTRMIDPILRGHPPLSGAGEAPAVTTVSVSTSADLETFPLR